MQNIISKTKQTILILFLFIFAVSCDTAKEEKQEETDSITVWESMYNETYKISSSYFSYESGGYGFEADQVVDVPETSSKTAGIFYLRISKNNGWWSSGSPVGKWYAVAYKEQTSSSIKLSNACTTSPECEMTCQDSLETAKSYFVPEKYFGYYAELEKK